AAAAAVGDRTRAGGTDITAGAVRAHLEELRGHTLQAYLQVAGDALRGRGLQVETTLTHGVPSDQILYATDDPAVDLVAISTHGRGGRAGGLLASVPDKLPRRATNPVVIVPPVPASEQRNPAAFTTRLLVPLDGSALAEAALATAAELAQATGATLTLLRVE